MSEDNAALFSLIDAGLRFLLTSAAGDWLSVRNLGYALHRTEQT